MSRSAQPAGDSKIQAASSSRCGPQSPAHQSTLSTMPAGRKSTDERLLRISGGTAGIPKDLDLSLCTYNCRGLAKDEQLLLLMEEKSKIYCDVLGLCEVRRKKALTATWNDGSSIFLGQGEGPRSFGGVGFIVNRKWSANIISCSITSTRIGTLFIKLDERKTLKIIQVYAPTSASSDDEVEEFYNELQQAENAKSTYTVIIGDFNAKVGRGRPSEKYVGRYGLKERNERGERLVAMAESRRLFIGNSWFRKKPSRRWTWISPNSKTKNEIDFVLVSKKRILRNVEVVPLFNTGSDHRLLRANIHIDEVTEAKALLQSKPSKSYNEVDKTTFEHLIASTTFHSEDDIDEDYEGFVSTIRECIAKAEIKPPSRRKSRLSDETRQLMQKRKEMKRDGRNTVEYSLLCKLIRRKVIDDIHAYKQQRILKAAKERKSIKKCRRNLMLYRHKLSALRDEDGALVTSREGMEEICKKFFSKLLASQKHVSPPTLPPSHEALPPILISEVRSAIHQMEDGKAPGKDGITAEVLKAGEFPLWRELSKRFNRYLELKKIPNSWKESKTVLLFKKGDREELKNYRPICLLSHIYKVFTKIITTRLTSLLDEHQPREQAGFRKGYSTRDHIFTLTQLLERSREYRLPLCAIFVDFEKAFDSVEVNAVLQSLAQQSVPSGYIELLKDANSGCTTDITLFDKQIRIPVGRGVKQGDTISPKLFSACLETVMRRLNQTKGIKIDGENINHLRFADDVVLLGESIDGPRQMLRELEKEGAKVGLKINHSKTKFMRSPTLPRARIKVGGEEIEEVDKYVYLGQEVNIENDLKGEVSRRRKAGWMKFVQEKEVLKSKLDSEVRANIFNSTILPAMLYGSETWSLTKEEELKLEVTERAMERIMLGISLKDHITNEEIRRRSKVQDVVELSRINKLNWAGHVSRMKDGRWTQKVMNWYPRDVKRPAGRPPRRWEDFVKAAAGKYWRRAAQERKDWEKIVRTGRRAISVQTIDRPR